ncbi:MAG: homoserine kinase [Acidaminococcales bacterium]|nr:homoserine kinase [Acidaminococcales bacterium]
MPDTVTVKVPATSANCGPGFDSIGLACAIYNTLTLSCGGLPGIRLAVTGQGEEFLKPSEKNFAVMAIRRVLREADWNRPGLDIKMHNGIPMSRGLGSSAAAIVGGMAAANALAGGKLSRERIFELATEMEGHPDNVAPAIYGGFTISFMENGKPRCMRLDPPDGIRMVAAVPDFPLPTKLARDALPEKAAYRDAVFNIGRAALLAASIAKGDVSFLRFALKDKLHQPYRGKFIPGMENVFAAAEKAGALGSFISGSGSALMSFVPKEADAEMIGEKMCAEFARFGKTAVWHILGFDLGGAYVV